LIVTYAILLIIIMIIQIALGIYIGVYKDDAQKLVTTEMQAWARDYGFRPALLSPDGKLIPQAYAATDNDSKRLAATNGWNAMQVYLQCCGATGYLDFQASSSPYWGASGGVPPVFCCKMSNPLELKLLDTSCYHNGRNPPLASTNMNLGCIQKVEGYVTDNAPAVIGVAVGIGLVELIGIIFAFCLCCAVGDKGRRYN